jgi:tetratricopeptide (TPR) repeat protein/TolB-like protein
MHRVFTTGARSLDNFFGELRRRRVFRVAGAYAIVAWLIVQAAEITFDAFELPSWAMQLVIILCVLGFPVAVVLAWAFDLTPRGLQRTGAAGAEIEAGDVIAVPGLTRSPGRARMMVGLVIVAAVAAGALTVMRLTGPDDPVIHGDPRHSLIVFPFENLTGSAEHDYLQDASMDLLGLAISHWAEMRVYDDERTTSLMRRRGIESASDLDFDLASGMAGEAEVGTFVLGELRFEGDSLTVEAKVYDLLSGERIATEVDRVARDGDPRVPFNSIAAGILHVSGAPPGERPDLLAQTTQSLEAYRAYFAGSRALQLFQVDTARARFLRAVELDTTFALAYLRLRDVDGWANIESDPGWRREMVAKAVSHKANLPPRYRLLVEYYEAYELGRLQRAREIAEEMIARDSSDVEAWYQLGEAHFHHGPDRFPHPDTLGNMGTALAAFRRALELDSAYVLAYQHIVDVLGNCGADNQWLCFADSAVYATREQLEREYGNETVMGMRARAREDVLRAGYAWVAAAPRSMRARNELLASLLRDGRVNEARSQIDMLRGQGSNALASAWESRILTIEHDYGGAARTMDRALDDPVVQRELIARDSDLALGALIGGARLQRAKEFMGTLLSVIPLDTVSGPNGITYSKTLLAQLMAVGIQAVVGAEAEILGVAIPAWLDAIDEGYEPGTEPHQMRWTASGSTVLAAYLATKDTMSLARFLAAVDTTGSRTWRTMDGHMSLARGDSSRARVRLGARFTNRDEVELRGDPGAVRLFAWAKLLEELGQLREAAEAYALFDTDASPNLWGALHVRSWYERAELYRQLGEEDRAVDMYAKFVEAWAEGDDVVQPLVADARAAMAQLAGAR